MKKYTNNIEFSNERISNAELERRFNEVSNAPIEEDLQNICKALADK